jgi:hypothetical protein
MSDRPAFITSLGDRRRVSINHLIFAHPGIGKTPYWATAGRGLLLMDSDNGTESAMVAGGECDTCRIFDYAELDEVYEFARHENKPNDGGYKWFAWDSLTLFMDRSLIDDITAAAHSANPNKQSPWIPSQREYMTQQSRISTMVRRFCGLPTHFGLSCLVDTEEDPDGKLMYVPMIPGQGGAFGAKIRGYMNVVSYMSAPARGQWRMLTKTTDGYFSRDRFGALYTPVDGKRRWYLDNPTVPMVERKIKEKLVGKGQAASRQGSRRTGK